MSYQLDMSALDEMWSVVARLEALDRLLVVVTGVGQPLNGVLSRSILNDILKVHRLSGIGEARFAVDRDIKLIPKLLLVDNVSVERRYVELREPDSGTIRSGCQSFSSFE